MSDAAVFAILAAIPTTLTGIGTLYLLIRNSKKSDDNSAKADKKSDKIIEQGDQIHVAVNSNLTKVKADLEIANQEIAVLKQERVADRIGGLETLVRELVDANTTTNLKKNGENRGPEAAADKLIKAVGVATEDAVAKIEAAKEK